MVARTVREGLLAFDVPDAMRQGRKERVQIGIARNEGLVDGLAAALNGLIAQLTLVSINTSDVMRVELRARLFAITPLSQPTQLIVPIARWQFDVYPAQVRDARAHPDGRVHPQHSGPGRASHRVPAFDRSIEVKIDLAFYSRRMLAANWRWVWGHSWPSPASSPHFYSLKREPGVGSGSSQRLRDATRRRPARAGPSTRRSRP